jgi:hypothetical protein
VKKSTATPKELHKEYKNCVCAFIRMHDFIGIDAVYFTKEHVRIVFNMGGSMVLSYDLVDWYRVSVTDEDRNCQLPLGTVI